MTQNLKFRGLSLLFAAIALSFAIGCAQPTSSGGSSATPSVSKPTAVIKITNGANIQGSLYQTTTSDTVDFSAEDSVALTGSSLISWTWDFGDTTTASGETADDISFAASDDTYTVSLTVVDDQGRSDTDTVKILVNDPPTVSFSADDISANEDADITFEATTDDGDGDIVSYEWNWDDGTTDGGTLSSGESVPSLVHAYDEGGSYTVTLTVTDNDGTSASDTMTASITDPDNTAPDTTSGFTMNTTGSTSTLRVNRNISISFDASGITDDQEGLSFGWDFGDGSTGAGETATHSYAAGGDYTVTLTATDCDGVSVNVTATASVNYQPTASITSDDPADGICYVEGETVQFYSNAGDAEDDADGLDLTYSWTFGDGGTSTEENPAHSFSATGDYDVTLTVTDSEGDYVTLSGTGTVNALPSVTITGIPTGSWVNQNSEFTLTCSVSDGNDDSFTYAWDMGDGTTYATEEVTHTYTGSTDRTIGLTVTDSYGQSGSDSITLEVNAAPTVSFTMDDDDARINPNTTVAFDATVTEPDGDALTYGWTVNGTSVASTEDLSYEFTAAGDYTIAITATDTRGAQGTAFADITVNAAPVAAFNGPDDNYGVEGESLTFTDASTDTEDTALDYAWDFGDGSTSTEASPIHAFAAYGSYEVSLTVTDDDGLTDTATATIAVNALPAAVISGTPDDDTVDMGAAFTLSGSTSSDEDDSIASYLWTMSDGTTYTTADITHTFATNADGDITLTVTDQDGETDTDTYAISVNGAPAAAFSADDTTVNPVSAVSFTASCTDPDDDSLTYSWDFGDGSTGTGASASHSYASSGEYTVTLTVSDGRLSDSLTRTDYVYVNTAPSADAGADQEITDATDATQITLDGTGSSDADGDSLTYSWAFSSVPTDSSFSAGSSAGLTGAATAAPSFTLADEEAAAIADGTLVYTLELTVTDEMGLTDTDSVTVTVDGEGLVNVTIQ